jgi:hypothetical protein
MVVGAGRREGFLGGQGLRPPGECVRNLRVEGNRLGKAEAVSA